MNNMRKESDSLGVVEVPADKLCRHREPRRQARHPRRDGRRDARRDAGRGGRSRGVTARLVSQASITLPKLAHHLICPRNFATNETATGQTAISGRT